MSEDTKPLALAEVVAALRERLYELHHQRDLVEMELSKVDARISEIAGMIKILDPPSEAKRKRGSKDKERPFRVVPSDPPPELPPEPENAA